MRSSLCIRHRSTIDKSIGRSRYRRRLIVGSKREETSIRRRGGDDRWVNRMQMISKQKTSFQFLADAPSISSFFFFYFFTWRFFLLWAIGSNNNLARFLYCIYYEAETMINQNKVSGVEDVEVYMRFGYAPLVKRL